MHDRREELRAAIERLRQGGLVAFPTETVYGLGADAFNESAVRAVFEAKGRPAYNPLIVHVSGVDMARTVVREWTDAADALADVFWPGPLTIVLPKSPRLPDLVTAGGDTVAVRRPEHALTLALIDAFASPLVGPSANLSGRISPTTADHVRAAFTDRRVYVLDGGPCRAGIESTVVDLSGERAAILRPGPITPERISHVLGIEPSVLASGTSRAATFDHRSSPPPASTPRMMARRSPGMLDRHYAPSSPARLINEREIAALPADAVVLCFQPIEGRRFVTMPRDAIGYAARLYAALRQADDLKPSLIAIVTPFILPPGAHESNRGPDDAEERSRWSAIMDRLRRATTPGTEEP
jgi:L-threonylcarbamoyladenylate synthase